MNCVRWCLVLVFVLRASVAFSVEAVANYTVFHRPNAGGKDSIFLEVYWSINPSSLHYKKKETGELFTQIQVAVSVSTDSGLITRDRYVLQTTPAKPGAAAQQNLYQLKRYAVPDGVVQLRIDLGEAEFPRQTFQYRQTIKTVDTTTGAHFAALQLLDTFAAAKEPAIYHKNGFIQVPRVLNFYDDGQRLLHFYSEFYARNRVGEQLVQHFYLAKHAGDFPIIRFKIFDTLKKAAPVEVSHHTFDIATLESGNYYLNAQLLNAKGEVIDTHAVFFQMINTKPEEFHLSAKDSTLAATQESNFLDLGKTFVSKFNTKQILAILKMITPVADPSELKAINNFLKQPDEMYMRYFVYNYFSKTNKQHPEAAWKEFASLIREINNEFNSGGKLGWQTDRGRVYLQYGKPDERVRVPNEAGAVPYEIWRYNSVGSTNQLGTFLFYQPGFSISDFILLTSTVTGELYNPAWKSMLYATGRSSGNGNSRAEQYMEGK